MTLIKEHDISEIHNENTQANLITSTNLNISKRTHTIVDLSAILVLYYNFSPIEAIRNPSVVKEIVRISDKLGLESPSNISNLSNVYYLAASQTGISNLKNDYFVFFDKSRIVITKSDVIHSEIQYSFNAIEKVVHSVGSLVCH